MYLRHVKISNIKCFASVDLDFSGGPETGLPVRRWTALLGQNGLGKSTLLQAIAAALAGPGAIRELLPVADGWVRQGIPYGQITAELLWTEGDAQLPRWPKKTPYSARFIVTGADPDALPASFLSADRPTVPSILEWTGEGEPKTRERIAKEMNRLKKTAYAEGKPGWLACGYGPFRRLSGGSQDADKILYSGRKAARFVTLFREDAALTSATDWLVSLYNTARDGDTGSGRALELVKQAVGSDFLLETAKLHVDARSARLEIAERGPVPFKSLSDGYRSMLALGIDLLRWLIQAFPESTDPMGQSGVVLIDELDAHLHPKWQQQIGDWLMNKFRGLQFIVATHSPFLAQVGDAGGNIVLRERSGEVTATDFQKVTAWRADQILVELFGLDSTLRPDIRERLARYWQLEKRRRKNLLSPQEIDEHGQLRLDLGEMPGVLEDPEERETAAALRCAVNARADALQKLE